MKYLTVGTRQITRELFRSIEDVSGSIKPRGGLWLTEYNELYKNYNDWVDFMINDPVVLFYKSRNHSIWEQPCSLVTLKETANIFYLKSESDLEYLKKMYPAYGSIFSYQMLSKIYDGIFVDMYKLLTSINDDIICNQLFKFGVNSLILFNLNCIDYYQSGMVSIEPFDYEYGSCEPAYYEINIENEKQKIDCINIKKKTLIKNTNN